MRYLIPALSALVSLALIGHFGDSLGPMANTVALVIVVLCIIAAALAGK